MGRESLSDMEKTNSVRICDFLSVQRPATLCNTDARRHDVEKKNENNERNWTGATFLKNKL